jgi:hypothetical protein
LVEAIGYSRKGGQDVFHRCLGGSPRERAKNIYVISDERVRSPKLGKQEVCQSIGHVGDERENREKT